MSGTEVLALEMHVDYWNGLGWADPFSQATYSRRQARYAAALGERGPYTPQLVIDGKLGFVGSDKDRALREIAAAAAAPKPTIHINADGGSLHLMLPPLADAANALVLVAITESGLATQVPRGENAGRRLVHGPIVRSLRSLGPAQGGATLTAVLNLDGRWKTSNLRAVAFVQRHDDPRVLAVGSMLLR